MKKSKIILKKGITYALLIGLMLSFAVSSPPLSLTNTSSNLPKSSGDILLGTIKPNENLISNWNEGDTSSHYLLIDEAPEDLDGDDGNLRETTFGVDDRWGFTTLTIPIRGYISKLELYSYCKVQYGKQTYINITSNAFGGNHWWDPDDTGAYTWQIRTITQPNINQYALNSLYLNVEPGQAETNGWVDIEAVYIKVYYQQRSSTIQYTSPVQWSDFSFGGYGSPGGQGNTEFNDGIYAYANALQYTSAYISLGTIKPNGNLISNWNEGDTSSHYLLIDEAPGDLNGDNGNIRETTFGVDDRWNFGTLTIPSGAFVSKLELRAYCKVQYGKQTYIKITSNAFGGNHWWDPDDTGAYTWKVRTITGLNINQNTLNSLYLNVEPGQAETNGWVDIEAVYINVYYSYYQYRFSSIITTTLPSVMSINNLKYDYRTTIAIDCDLDIKNWNTGGWEELESTTTTEYVTGYYALSDPYIDNYNKVQIRFETAISDNVDFDLQLDQLCIQSFNPSDPPRNTLIGSENRFFPDEVESRLGFTINTTSSNVAEDTELFFSITEQDNDPYERALNVYVDDQLIYGQYFNITPYCDALIANSLKSVGGHQIVIEITDGSYGSTPHYKLEYLIVGNIEYEEIDVKAGYYYSPTQDIYYGASKDYGTVSICTRHQAEDLELNMTHGTTKKFHTSIITTIDPAVAAHYIDSLIVMWRVLDPNGNYLDTSNYDTVNSILVSPDGTIDKMDINFLYAAVYEWIVDLGGDIPYGLGTWIKLLTGQLASSPIIEDPVLEHYSGSNNYYNAKYADGRQWIGNAKYPYYSEHQMSMLIEWEVDWPNTLLGSYQIEIAWCVNIFDKSDILYYLQPMGEYSLFGTQYLNFEII